ncbi:hypothetical protein FC52_GL001589 [Lactobacillus pasteurii DSM 23907 = CRBIP 24.76]|uniref:Uncharacterized protein n=1 Tax=Lactobacillus pasteurii DSM 23907 = CRBIP 24.76 TaxID=1423790 RepID=I7IYT3_9LACO|nr:hypothetical protein [Lactobacillus pasteurii]KRK07699.1 hypothetical protein FC52_GL001589 [Lactobacillus pasteurii DSM 23907 = CRBIP 24.76]TDG77708.1 hypothetical protein C5L33_000119 [Lactobacillus pasteurii]CCI84707.1 Protein of unknown function [Lactobacillus pasteurii DSM 23907 = CRBIP 24.76]
MAKSNEYIIDKYKLRGLKRYWRYNLDYFEKLLNDPEEIEFFFVYTLETHKTKISGKYKRWLINFLLEAHLGIQQGTLTAQVAGG